MEVLPEELQPPTPRSPKKKLTKQEKKWLKLKTAEDAKKKGIREHLIREIKYAKSSYLRGFDTWEKICKEIKLKELHDDLKDWWQRTNRIMDRKNFKLKLLQHDLETADEQNDRNFSWHCQLLDYLESFYSYSLDTMKSQYESQASEMIQVFYEELKAREIVLGNVQERTQNVMHAANIISENNLTTMSEKFFDRQYEIANTQIECRYILRDKTVREMSELRNQLAAVMTAIKQDSMDERREERFNAMMERQKTFVIESQKLNDSEGKGNALLSTLQKQLVHNETNLSRKLSDLRLERSYFIEVYWRLKRSVAMNNERTQAKLRILASESHEAIKHLKQLEKYGGLLVSLAACCRKFETEKEKVTPWHEGKLGIEGTEVQKSPRLSFDMEKLVHCSEECILDQLTSLQQFWYRVSTVQSHNLLLQQELENLQKKNRKYRDIIKCIAPEPDNAELLQALRVSPLTADLVDQELFRQICVLP